MNTSSNNTSNWFYIKHVSTDKVIATCRPGDTFQPDDYVRSQVVVTRQDFTDNELWCWDENYLRNKSTGLVLDIRKGRLRLIEDTEVCLFYKKPYEMSQNQLWATRPAAGSESTITEQQHPLFKSTLKQSSPGNVIYSICNSGWVLDIFPCPEDDSSEEDQHKLILFPQHQNNSSPTQRWEFIQEDFAHTNDNDILTTEPSLLFEDNLQDSIMTDDSASSIGYTSGSSSISCESIGFPHGLTPAKRSSQSSLSSMNRKESLEDFRIYPSYQQHQTTIFN